MITYTIYDSTTGQITGSLTASTAEMIQANLANKSYIEGDINPHMYYISNGAPVEMPARPATSLGTRVRFDWNTKTWTVDNSAVPALMRAQRNKLLKDTVDKVNAVWYTNLSPDQQQEFRTYRTALLDVPQQSGFPTNITWPTKPAWL